ncbi:hypothetical protein Lalb_Chr01g0005181 [Lupinus albus]|uniref:Uncharacterized protein n=1 Tax=Lupinus albus TaxID=3870 RepID=A0A6A4R3R9_LUPAL|nr:hypothetical protein Lalb_Chr01g0005181 [Lupinus albus]
MFLFQFLLRNLVQELVTGGHENSLRNNEQFYFQIKRAAGNYALTEKTWNYISMKTVLERPN